MPPRTANSPAALDDVDARVAEPVEPPLQRVPARLVAGGERQRFGAEDVAGHHVLPQRGHRRDDDLRPIRAQIGQQRHARAAFGRRIERPDRFVARAHQRHAARVGLAEIVGEVGERALRNVGRRHDDQHRSAERTVNAGQQVRPRGGGRFVQREREPAVGRRAQALDQLGQWPAARGQRAHERGCEYHRSKRRVTGTLVLRPSAADAVTVIEKERLSKKNGMPFGI